MGYVRMSYGVCIWDWSGLGVTLGWILNGRIGLDFWDIVRASMG